MVQVVGCKLRLDQAVERFKRDQLCCDAKLYWNIFEQHVPSPTSVGTKLAGMQKFFWSLDPA